MKIDEIISETATAGGTGAGSVASSVSSANGFASGGIGTISRKGTISKGKKKRKKSS